MNRNDLDRHITGNYGEDQFRDDEPGDLTEEAYERLFGMPEPPPFEPGDIVLVTDRRRQPATRTIEVTNYHAVITGIEEREPGYFYVGYRPLDHPNWFGFGCTWINLNGLGVSMRSHHGLSAFGVVAMDATGRKHRPAPRWTPTPGDPAFDSVH